jgi:hypothetical protein
VEPLDVRPDGSNVDLAAVDPDLIRGRDRDQDVAALLHLRRLRFGAVDILARFLHERGGHDEEDEHDEHHVQHGREIDFFLLGIRASPPSHLVP